MAGTLVISDIHSNPWALDAVIKHAREHFEPDELWALGDLFGYGPGPYAVWNKLTRLPWRLTCLAGNHDWGILGELASSQVLENTYLGYFRVGAWKVILFQREILENQQTVFDFLKSIPVMASPRSGVYLAHGSFDEDLQQSVARYTNHFSMQDALTPQDFANRFWQAAARFPDKVWAKECENCAPRLFFTGHTHLKKLWQWQGSESVWQEHAVEPGKRYSLAEAPLFVNPGSVGFPRDPSGCPSYVFLDWEQQNLIFQNVPYKADALKNAMAVEPYDTLINDKQFFIEPCAQETEI